MSGPPGDLALYIRQGRRRLRALLPQARAEAKAVDGELHFESALAVATRVFVREDNFDSLVVHPAPVGGWHADLVFKEVPPGLPNCMGSPVASPYATRELAEQAARRLLVVMLRESMENAARQQAGAAVASDAVFMLDGVSLRLPRVVYDQALAAMPLGKNGYGSTELAHEKVREIVGELFPNGVSLQATRALDRDQCAMLYSVLITATLTGVFTYPPRRDASPSGHSEAEHSQARH